jgi:hypothetical protein
MRTSTDRPVGQLAVPILAFIAMGVLAACGDFVAPSDRVPSGVAFEDSVVTVTEGEPIELRPYVVDQAGNRMDRLPVWVGFEWSTTNAAVFDPNGSLLARAPGQAYATATLAELSGRATVRVNPSTLAVAIPQAYLVQAVQRRDGSVPLVANRAAALRIFATGDAINFFEPDVEVTFQLDGEVVGRERIGLTRGGSIPTRLDEGIFENSWILEVPAQWVQPGLAFSVTLDPDGLLPLANAASARFPADGVRAVDVRRVPDLELRFVPVHQTRFGTTGMVNAASVAGWTEFMEDVFPVAGIQRDVREVFYTDAATPGGETDWHRIIQEIWALRVLDNDDRYYYGVLRFHGGYAGLGYVGWPVAIGWDRYDFPANDPIPLAYSTYAHEIGHNFGRWHAPACGPGNVDASFPHPGGTAGVYGLHRSLGEITRPSMPDLMGYCRPRWVSDYTWEGVLDFRINLEDQRRRAGIAGEAGPGLLIWGTITDGEARLEPAIALVRAQPLPDGAADLVVEGFDAAGRTLFREPAASKAFSHGPVGTRAFSAVVPMAAAEADLVHAIRVSGPGVREGTRRGRLAASPAEARDLAAGRAPGFAAVGGRPGRTELVWDAGRFPLVVVRDAGTGTVVAMARRGRIELPLPADRLTFDISDGVRSVRARPVRP